MVLGDLVSQRVEFSGDKINQFGKGSIAFELGAVPAILHTQDDCWNRSNVEVESQLFIGWIRDIDRSETEIWIGLKVFD